MIANGVIPLTRFLGEGRGPGSAAVLEDHPGSPPYDLCPGLRRGNGSGMSVPVQNHALRNSTMRKLILLAALLAAPVPALAHVVAAPGEAKAGSYAAIAFRV